MTAPSDHGVIHRASSLVEVLTASQSEFQQHSVDQTVDIPVQCGDGRRGELHGLGTEFNSVWRSRSFQDFFPGQSSTASSSVHRPSAAILGVYFSRCYTLGSCPNLLSLMSLDRSKWPRCLLWHGWLPGLSCAGDSDPWATSFGDLACGGLEPCLGAYPVDCSGYWTPPEYWDADDIALEMPDHPNIWTDGSREDFYSVAGFEVAGAGVYLPVSEVAFDHSVW